MADIKNFAEYFADEERVSAQDREAINLEKELILRLVEAREAQELPQHGSIEKSDIKK